MRRSTSSNVWLTPCAININYIWWIIQTTIVDDMIWLIIKWKISKLENEYMYIKIQDDYNKNEEIIAYMM